MPGPKNAVVWPVSLWSYTSDRVNNGGVQPPLPNILVASYLGLKGHGTVQHVQLLDLEEDCPRYTTYRALYALYGSEVPQSSVGSHARLSMRT